MCALKFFAFFVATTVCVVCCVLQPSQITWYYTQGFIIFLLWVEWGDAIWWHRHADEKVMLSQR